MSWCNVCRSTNFNKNPQFIWWSSYSVLWGKWRYPGVLTLKIMTMSIRTNQTVDVVAYIQEESDSKTVMMMLVQTLRRNLFHPHRRRISTAGSTKLRQTVYQCYFNRCQVKYCSSIPYIQTWPEEIYRLWCSRMSKFTMISIFCDKIVHIILLCLKIF